MDLAKMLTVAGIGCGKECVCVHLFADSLSPLQQEMLGHMIKKGAKRHLQKIKDAIKEDGDNADDEVTDTGDLRQRVSGIDFFEQMFRDAFGPNRSTHFDPAETLRRASESAVEPYTGDLTPDQVTTIAEAPEEIREKLEAELRRSIARSGSNPKHVILKKVGSTYVAGLARAEGSSVMPPVLMAILAGLMSRFGNNTEAGMPDTEEDKGEEAGEAA